MQTTYQISGGVRIVTAVLRAPFGVAAWRATAHLLAGLPLGVTSFAVVVLFGGLTVGLAVTVVPAIGSLAVLVWATAGFTRIQRRRFGVLLGVAVAVDEPPPTSSGGWLQWLLGRALDPRTGRQLCYHLLAFPVSLVGAVTVGVAWSTGAVLVCLVAYPSLLGEPSAGRVLVSTLAGLALVFAAPWLAIGMSTVDIWLAERLLGQRPVDRLRQRIAVLTVSRAGAVAAADAERRRIERDLHDGTQQRLTSLAMNLGMAREELADTDPTHPVIVGAHEEAKQALAELRSLVRGLHPPVLSERGLDSALSGLASRSPLPVRLQVAIRRRPSATVESVAYFVVSEALSNVTKHARATQVYVTARRDGDLLRVSIVDNGRGGAGEDGTGTGLRGLRHRVAAVDGQLAVRSRPGGGTEIVAELPCES